MYCKAALLLLLPLVLQILFGSVIAESSMHVPGYINGTSLDLRPLDFDEMGGFVQAIWNNVTIYDKDCNASYAVGQASQAVDQGKVRLCGFAVCCFDDGRGDSRSTGHHCFLELLASAALSNATLVRDVCNAGQDSRECRFAKCCVADKRGLDYAKFIGSDCYSSIGPSSPLQAGIGVQLAATMLYTVLATILSWISIVFFTY